jgi:hypothetical protein
MRNKLEIQDKIIMHKRLGRVEVSDDILVFFVWRHVIVFACFIILPFHIVLNYCLKQKRIICDL